MIFRIIKKIYTTIISNNEYINYLRKQGVKVGENCVIDKSAVFGSEPYLVSIGNNVRITRNVKFITHDGGLWVLRNMNKIDKNIDKINTIEIGNNVNVGWDSIILPGVNIGDNVVIGAGAIVTKDIPNNSVVAGVPARIIESIDEYRDKVLKKAIQTKKLSKKEKKNFYLKK